MDAWLTILYSVFGPDIFSFALWANALRCWPTIQGYPFNNIIPIWTVFRTWLFFREPISTNIWIALVLIVCGVIFSTRNWTRAKAL